MRFISGLELNSAGHWHSRTDVAYLWPILFKKIRTIMELFFKSYIEPVLGL